MTIFRPVRRRAVVPAADVNAAVFGHAAKLAHRPMARLPTGSSHRLSAGKRAMP